jgi:hypothetical protein
METPGEFEESLEMDGCSYPARHRRARDNGWPHDLKSLNEQEFDFQLGIWRFKDKFEKRK